MTIGMWALAGGAKVLENSLDFNLAPADSSVSEAVRGAGMKLANLLEGASSPKNVFAFLADPTARDLDFQMLDAGFKTVDGKTLVTIKLSTTVPRADAVALKQKFMAIQR